MSGQLAGLVGKKVMAESAKNHFGGEDPYFERVPASRLGRAFGKKTQKRRKAIPPGLSENDSKVLTKVKRRAYRLDYSLFSLCGVRFGWSSAIALIPFIGDGADALLALMVVHTCGEIDGGLPSGLQMRMLFNVMIDFVIGLVPFFGDIADAMYKCNSRNAVLLEKHLREKGAKTLSKQKKPQDPGVDMSLPEEFDRYEEYGAVDTKTGVEMPTKPESAKHPDRNRAERGWFGGSKVEDLEHGYA